MMEDLKMTHIKINNCFEEKRTFFVSVWNFADDDTIIEHWNEIIQLDPDEDTDIKTKNDIEKTFHSRFPYDYIDVYPLTFTYNGIEFKEPVE